MNSISVQIKKLRDNAVIPTCGSSLSAGYDLYACVDSAVIISPGETCMIGTGLSIAVPEGFFGAIFARSGLSSKQGLRPANCVGVCDSDYRGEYIVPLHNDSFEKRTVKNGDRIAQLILLPCMHIDFVQVQQLDETERANGGFGSTGK